MKICIYDVVDFEKNILKELEAEISPNQMLITQEHLSITNLDKAKGCDGISVLGYSVVDESILAKLADMNIRHISTRTIGYDHIDIKAAKRYGISVYNASYDPNNVADFAVMTMLMMLRKAKISICRALVNDFSLNDMKGREMRSLTIGIIGTGKIGTTVIKNLSGFGCRVLCCDPYENEVAASYATYVDIDTIYNECDIISLHTPLTDDNYHMIDDEAIAKMKPGVILINTARGQLVDTESLIRGLEKGHVGGAAVDTLEEEQGIMHVAVGTRIVDNRSLLYLKQFPNVIYTQHYAFYTEEAVESMVRCGITSIINGFYGDNTTTCVTR